MNKSLFFMALTSILLLITFLPSSALAADNSSTARPDAHQTNFEPKPYTHANKSLTLCSTQITSRPTESPLTTASYHAQIGAAQTSNATDSIQSIRYTPVKPFQLTGEGNGYFVEREGEHIFIYGAPERQSGDVLTLVNANGAEIQYIREYDKEKAIGATDQPQATP